MKKPPRKPRPASAKSEPLATPEVGEARPAARLARALMLLVDEHAAAYRLTEGGVLGALTLALGLAAAGVARGSDQGLEGILDFVVKQLRQAASAEFTRRPFTLH